MNFPYPRRFWTKSDHCLSRSRADPTGEANSSDAAKWFTKFRDLYLPNIFDFSRFANLFQLDVESRSICTYESMTTDGTMAHLQFKEWRLVEVDKDGNPIESVSAETTEKKDWDRAKGK
jgi:hypothetical protein